MPHALESYVAIADALALLLKPHAEVVLHDLERGTIFHMSGGLSLRQPGDPSLTEIEDVVSSNRRIFGPYAKTNFDGRKMRSVSAAISDRSGFPIGLFCINLDVSVFEAMRTLSRDFLCFADTEAKPSVLFETDWQEEVNDIVGQFLSDHRLSLNSMTAEHRASLAALLDARGLFEIRNAVPYIARVLNLSRATLYKTLKTVRAPRP
ncbi:putative transcriptional regulator YheO [Mesorhizobium soli]|uniref:helix-turn-helix transcriptional regulator n=1 Tax=Pseudaminobacter soli (ex Li et al. 2025) TaxID=1295366 RepID=UPI002475B631|nr:PAS domain-containing protein [Mesorhizobium soli]MDH6233122.1 putative transcriptional regulator YheO [Mesorhizobium soli]